MPHGDPSESLNAITAPDIYGGTTGYYGVIEGTPIARLVIDVSNQAIYWQLKRATGSNPSQGAWEGNETFMIPGSRVIARNAIVGVRVRAAISSANLPAGSIPAVVTVEAVK